MSTAAAFIPSRLPRKSTYISANHLSRSACWKTLSATSNDDNNQEDEDQLSILEAERRKLQLALETAQLREKLQRLQRESDEQADAPKPRRSEHSKDYSGARANTGERRRKWAGTSSSDSSRSNNDADAWGRKSRTAQLRQARGSEEQTPGLRAWGRGQKRRASTDLSADASAVEALLGALRGKPDQPQLRSPDLKAASPNVGDTLGGGSRQQRRDRSLDGIPVFKDSEIWDAMRKGVGTSLVKAIIEEGPNHLTAREEDQEERADGLERMAAWGSLVAKTTTSSQYRLTVDKVLALQQLSSQLLPPLEFTAADIASLHRAIIMEVGAQLRGELAEIRRRRGSTLYVLLSLSWGNRGMSSQGIHQEQVDIGHAVSMESSLGFGCRMIIESTSADCLPSSLSAASLMSADSFRAIARALLDLGSAARQMLITSYMPVQEALKGLSFFLVPWLRRITNQGLEKRTSESTARLKAIMELAHYAAESMALLDGAHPGDLATYEQVVQQMLKDKIGGMGVDIAPGIRSALLTDYIESWVTECFMQRSLPVPWADSEGRVRRGDIAAWTLARQVLGLSEMQLLIIAKEIVPYVLGRTMAEVFSERNGSWPRGSIAFESDFSQLYKRLKCDKYEGSAMRCKAIRVMDSTLLQGKREAVVWGCETLGLGEEEFVSLAEEQGRQELQAEIVEVMLSPGHLQGGEIGDRIEEIGRDLRLGEANVQRALISAVQIHIGNLAVRALFADLEGAVVKSFQEIDATYSFIKGTAAYLEERFACRINPTARIIHEDGLQVANICNRMLNRGGGHADSAQELLRLLGYSNR